MYKNYEKDSTCFCCGKDDHFVNMYEVTTKTGKSDLYCRICNYENSIVELETILERM